ncbi:MAG: DNA primase [Patescibacteria group bacterium]|jgi:DNA primase
MLTPVEEIKSRLDIVDLLQEYIKVAQAGANWKARCPFHNEKTPSFMISREKQIWHCFGCGEGGDIFTFVQKIEGLDFPEALRLLADKAGVVVQKQDPQMLSQRARLIDLNELAAKYYQRVLHDSSVAKAARDYLAGRGVDQLTIDNWQLGYAPDSWDETANFLKKKGYGEQEIFLAGLTVKKDPASSGGASRGSGFYDRFRGRLSFPIRDQHGQVVGFSARCLEADAKTAKYINSPQTAIFNKGQILFGLDRAKQEIRIAKMAVLVEGNLDVITSHQYGVKNVVASCGTAMTIDQVKLLKRYSDNLALCFDPDAAGRLAADRGIEVALSAGMNVKVIKLPAGEDPDKFIKNHSAAVWQEKIKAARPVMEYYFSEQLDNADLRDPQVKKAAAQKLLPAIARLTDSVEQTHWLQKLAESLSVPENILRETIIKLFKKPGAREAEKPALHASLNRPAAESERFLAILFKYPENLPYAIEQLLPEMLWGEKVVRLYTDLIIYYNRAKANWQSDNRLWWQDFSATLDKELIDYANQLALLIEQEEDELPADKVKEEIITIVRDLKKDYYTSQLRKIGTELKQAESAGQAEAVKALAGKFSQVAGQLYNLG